MGTNRPTRMWELARAVVRTRDCPTCDQPKDEWCVTLREDKTRRISVPHPARYPSSSRRQSDPANAALLPERQI